MSLLRVTTQHIIYCQIHPKLKKVVVFGDMFISFLHYSLRIYTYICQQLNNINICFISCSFYYSSLNTFPKFIQVYEHNTQTSEFCERNFTHIRMSYTSNVSEELLSLGRRRNCVIYLVLVSFYAFLFIKKSITGERETFFVS